MDNPRLGARSHFDDDEQRPPTTYSRRHLLFAGIAATATVGYASCSTNQATDTTRSATPNTPLGTTTTTPPTTLPQPVEAAAIAPATTSTTVPELGQTPTQGMAGAEVQAMQEALAALNFDPGPIDGIFGGATVRSVWAFEKLVLGTPRTEMRHVVNPDIWNQMNSDVVVTPRRSPGGTHMEVYLHDQVSILFNDGEARVISHVSSGENIEWCDVVEIDLDDGTTEEKGICGISKTPGGVYHFERKVDGWRNAKLGRLHQPVYFNYGIAIHGAGNVPDYPASRGCVRHPMHMTTTTTTTTTTTVPQTTTTQPAVTTTPATTSPPTTSTTSTSSATTTAPTPALAAPVPPG